MVDSAIFHSGRKVQAIAAAKSAALPTQSGRRSVWFPEKWRILPGDFRDPLDDPIPLHSVEIEESVDRTSEVGDSTSKAWTDVKAGVSSAWEDLSKAMRDASNEF